MATEINTVSGISTRTLPMTDRLARAEALGNKVSQISQDDARSVLTTLREKLENGGRPRSGFLKLMHTTQTDRKLSFETKWKF